MQPSKYLLFPRFIENAEGERPQKISIFDFFPFPIEWKAFQLTHRILLLGRKITGAFFSFCLAFFFSMSFFRFLWVLYNGFGKMEEIRQHNEFETDESALKTPKKSTFHAF